MCILLIRVLVRLSTQNRKFPRMVSVANSTFAEKLKRLLGIGGDLSEELFEELTDLLVEGDFGAAEAFKTVEKLQSRCKKEGLVTPEQVKSALADILQRSIVPAAPGIYQRREHFTIILLLGVNGVGKTTTAASCGGYLPCSSD